MNDGFSYDQVSKILLLDDETIRRYYRIYESKGLQKLLESEYQGTECKLNEKEQNELIDHLESTIYLSAKSIVEYVKKRFKVKYTSNGMVQLLRRLEFRYKKPKKVPGKADAKKQHEFIDETYTEIKNSLGENDKVYFIDGVHPSHNPVASYGWIRKGVTKELKTNTGRKRININGALSLEKFDLVYREDETINGESTIQLLKQIEEKNPLSDQIYAIYDNARYYRSKQVSEYLENSKIKLIFLPPYSPNLNLIERLWKFLNKHLSYNRYHETFALFKKSCFEILDNLDNYPEELASLITENFEITGKNFSHS